MAEKSKHKSFLVINTFGIGDVIFSTPLLRNLRDNFSEAKIYYLCNKKTASLCKANPLIYKIFVYERDEFATVQRASFIAGILKYLRFVSEIRKENIDCAIDLSLNTQFGLFAFLAGIKYRYGLDYKGRSKFLNSKVKIRGFAGKHVADYYLDVLKLLKIPVKKYPLEVYSDSLSEKQANEFFEKSSILKDELVIGIAPCGGDAFGKDNHFKRWPADRFSQLIDRLMESYRAKIFIFAGPNEKNDVAGIVNGLKIKKGVFEFSDVSLKGTVPLVRRCDLFISNDTGILRFADALKKKIVALYGPIDERTYGLYPDYGGSVILKKDLPCRPCYKEFRYNKCADRKCIDQITVDEVYAAVEKVLNR